MKVMKTNKNKILDNASKIWGIINITPDSFSDGALYFEPEKAFAHLLELDKTGADFFDIGAASSRPFAPFISEEEEWQRLEPFFALVRAERKELFSRISVDTWRASVAKKALEAGVFCINDISGFRWDEGLLEVLLEYQPYYILMHSLGVPETMQENIEEKQSKDIVETVFKFFEDRLAILDKRGFSREKIILDVGIGFGKTPEQNIELLRASKKFSSFNLPLMSAISRKSVLSKTFNIDKDNTVELDRATTICSLLLNKQGFTQHRIHNVKALVQAFAMEKTLN